jgi:hypothetical protein
MREGQNHVEPVLSRSQAIAVADDHQHLNRAQKSVVEDVLSSSDFGVGSLCRQDSLCFFKVDLLFHVIAR